MSEIKNRGQGRLFQNSFLESLSKASPLISYSVYIAVTLLLLSTGIRQDVVANIGNGVLIFVLAFMSWTLFEYAFHRFVNHLDYFIPGNPAIEKFDYIIHGIHHEYPRDTKRLIMPPVPGLLIIAFLFSIFWLLMGKFTYIFMPGFMVGYLLYTVIHIATHKWRPPKLLKPLWRHHALHHYKYPDKAFGVTTTLWDYIFGTMPPRDDS